MKIDIEGFTPSFDVMLKKYGPITTLVYGKLWRYCDWKGVAKASHQRYAKELGVSAKTIKRHIETLIKDGYVVNHNPKQIGGTYEYTVTNKVTMTFRASPTLDRESNPPGQRVRGTLDRESNKDSSKKEKEKGASATFPPDDVLSILGDEVINRSKPTTAPQAPPKNADEARARSLKSVAKFEEASGSVMARMVHLFGVDVSRQTKTNQSFIEWMRGKERTGEHMETFAVYWFRDDWRGKKGAAPSLNDIQTEWPKAFGWVAPVKKEVDPYANVERY